MLVEFNPHEYLASFGFDKETENTLFGIIYGECWNSYDRGDYKTIGDLRTALCKEYPEYSDELSEVLQPEWVNIHRVITDTAEYLGELKQRGYKIYILSNLSAESYEYIKKLDFFGKTDGGVFSTFENACKPEEKLYSVLLERYGLIADECVFLDDRPENIKVAEKLGIHGIVFTSFGEAKQQLENLLKQSESV